MSQAPGRPSPPGATASPDPGVLDRAASRSFAAALARSIIDDK
ncbi:MAG: hypothetical protein AAGA55_03470 [Planctomycetota bacterium]